ncbi:ATP-binding cassette domain-containing protein [Erwinia tracheiphila]|uniref:ATP-binding cassette domain-containing protein n=1 Tax=Erwinia tracheiphila TaxID=65700 RepID=UPI000698F888|nr:ATP-binding cassette domain-containing protein [Erwinia tracheiphila]UIA87529.1 ATP-binding cassette domain-containing protein [Erwinia tracheiphila]UIA95895.1 ATP-binding cassette domain-containing protein [Erwinia tracheiphila]
MRIRQKLCAGLLVPSSGKITVFDKPLDGINSHAGYMFQDEILLPWLTVLENVVLGLSYRGMPATESDSLGRSWLTRVGLSVVADYYPSQLSGGMRKRVALAQTLMVRKLNHRFKNFLTMSSSVCNAVMMCHRERYGHKMAFAARF